MKVPPEAASGSPVRLVSVPTSLSLVVGCWLIWHLFDDDDEFEPI